MRGNPGIWIMNKRVVGANPNAKIVKKQKRGRAEIATGNRLTRVVKQPKGASRPRIFNLRFRGSIIS